MFFLNLEELRKRYEFEYFFTPLEAMPENIILVTKT
jgi:hypothetical protein